MPRKSYILNGFNKGINKDSEDVDLDREECNDCTNLIVNMPGRIRAATPIVKDGASDISRWADSDGDQGLDLAINADGKFAREQGVYLFGGNFNWSDRMDVQPPFSQDLQQYSQSGADFRINVKGTSSGQLIVFEGLSATVNTGDVIIGNKTNITDQDNSYEGAAEWIKWSKEVAGYWEYEPAAWTVTDADILNGYAEDGTAGLNGWTHINSAASSTSSRRSWESWKTSDVLNADTDSYGTDTVLAGGGIDLTTSSDIEFLAWHNGAAETNRDIVMFQIGGAKVPVYGGAGLEDEGQVKAGMFQEHDNISDEKGLDLTGCSVTIEFFWSSEQDEPAAGLALHLSSYNFPNIDHYDGTNASLWKIPDYELRSILDVGTDWRGINHDGSNAPPDLYSYTFDLGAKWLDYEGDDFDITKVNWLGISSGDNHISSSMALPYFGITRVTIDTPVVSSWSGSNYRFFFFKI